MDHALATALRDLIDTGRTTGIQASIADCDGRVDFADGVDGLGEELTVESWSAWLCVTKLLSATCVLSLADAGQLDLGERLGSVSSQLPAPLADLTVWDLLTFQSGLWGENVERFMAMEPSARRDHLRRAGSIRVRRRRRFEAVYGQYVGYDLLGQHLEQKTGVAMSKLVTSYVLEPAGIVGEVSLGEPVDATKLRVSSGRCASGVVAPFLSEALHECSVDGSSANGAYGTARGWVQLAQFVARRWSAGDSLIACAAMQCTKRGVDPVLQRLASYGAGTWHSLVDHDFSARRVSARSFGLAGLGGAATVVTDLDAGRSLAWRDLRVHTSRDDLRAVRDRLVAATFEERRELL